MTTSLDKPVRFPPHKLKRRTRPEVKSGSYNMSVSQVNSGVRSGICITRFRSRDFPFFWNWVSITCVAERAAFVQIVSDGNGRRLALLG